MTIAKWINKNHTELSMQAKRLFSLHKAFPDDESVKQMLQKTIKSVQHKIEGARRQSEMKKCFDEAEKGWLSLAESTNV